MADTWEAESWGHALALTLDPQSDEPVYVRIRDRIATMIEDGRLAPGTRLPPVRDLARALSVNPMTVARAYRQLAEADLVKGRGGAGTTVLQRRAVIRPPTPPATPPDDIDGAASLSARLFDLAQAPGVISFTANYPDVAHSDVPVFRAIIGALAVDPDGDRFFRYDPPAGRDRLRQAIATFVEAQGISVGPGSVVVTSGGQQALDITVRALVAPGETVIVERPTYFGMLNVLRAARAEIVEVPTGPQGADVEALAALVKRHRPALISLNPSFQNPTGATMPRSAREAVLDIARNAGVPILEDDHYPEMRFRGDPVPPLKALAGPDEPVIYCRGFGKMFLPGARLGFAVVPPALMPRIATLKASTDLQSNALLQGALADWLIGGTWRAQAEATTRHYASIQEQIAARLEAILPEGSRFHRPDGGLNLWVELPREVVTSDIYFRAARRGVAFAAGDSFHAHRPNHRTMRLSFGRVDAQSVPEGLKRLELFIGDLCRPTHKPAAWFV